MVNLLGFETAEDIAKYMIEHAKKDNLRITIMIEPGRYEINVEPWKDVVMYCPYHQKEID